MSLEAEETTRVVECKHKRPVNGGVHDQEGGQSAEVGQVRPDRKSSLEIPKSLHVGLNADRKDRILTVVMGYGTRGLYGYSASHYCAIGEGFLGRRLVSLSPESRRRPACSSPKDDAGSRNKLDGTTATETQTMQFHTGEPVPCHRGLPCRACRQHTALSAASLLWHG